MHIGLEHAVGAADAVLESDGAMAGRAGSKAINTRRKAKIGNIPGYTYSSLYPSR